MRSRRAVLAGLASLPFAMAIPYRELLAAQPTGSIQGAARVDGRYYGTCVRMDRLDDTPTLRDEVLAQCSAITPEIHLKWNSVENKRGQFWFEPVDRMVEFAQQHGLRIHGHTLLWEQSTPNWALRSIGDDRDWGLVEGHIERVVGRYRHAIKQWDVINEAIDTQGGRNGLRQNSFFKAFGESYIARALETTHAYAPDARLFINDYSLEYGNYVEVDRRAAFLRLLEKLKSDGVPLHGVGIQAHLDLGKGPLATNEIRRFLQHVADMGLSIVVTELDVKEHDYRASLEVRDSRVADEVRRYLDIVLDQKAVEGVVTWGMTDRYSWLPAPNRGLPYDAEIRPKMMHAALRDAFVPKVAPVPAPRLFRP